MEDLNKEATVRSGLTPLPQASDEVQRARDTLAPSSLAEVQAAFGGITVGSSHPTGNFETNVDTRPRVEMRSKPTPSEESPPSVEEALAARTPDNGVVKTFKANKRYAVILKNRVEIEPGLELSPHAIHYIDGDLASKHKASIDVATEVAE